MCHQLEFRKRKERGFCKREKEFDRVHGELKYIAWKLYDLTCDFKDLQIDAKELYRRGRYENYEKHRESHCDRRKFDCSTLSKRFCAKEQQDEDYGSRKIGCSNASKSYCTKKEQVNEDECCGHRFDYSTLSKKCSAEDSKQQPAEDCEEYLKKYSSTSCKEYLRKQSQERANKAAEEQVKEKEEQKEEQEFAKQEDYENEEEEEEMRSRYSAPQSSYCHQYKSSSLDYEGLSTAELEQRLRERLQKLKMQKCKTEMSCNASTVSNSKKSQQQISCTNSLITSNSKKTRAEACGLDMISERSGYSQQQQQQQTTAFGVRCCRGKGKLEDLQSAVPHRVYLDGDKAYVVDHRNSKVIFIPKDIEY